MNEDKDFSTLDSDNDGNVTTSTRVRAKKKKNKIGLYLLSVLVAVGIIGGVLYNLEKQGRSQTNFFSSLIERQNRGVVAVVNGEKISQDKLDDSINRMLSASEFSSLDDLEPELKDQVKRQALEIVINTELVRQEIKNKKIEISNEELEERISEIKQQIGGTDVLKEEMKKLNIDEEQFRNEVRDELAFNRLLEPMMNDEASAVTDEDVEEAYNQYKNNFTGDEKDLQPLSEIKEEIRAQLKSYREQRVMADYLNNLRNQAEIKINI